MKKIGIISIILAFFANIAFAAEVNVFSARHYDSDIQLYEKFTAKTGIKVNVVSGKDKALQKRITEEGKDSKADLYITADAGRLGAFDAKGMFRNSMSKAIKAAVPSNFRSTNWTGIAKRARIMYYSPERVNANELNGMTYEGLADKKWRGRVVIRKSNNIYNQSLVASLVKNNGKDKTCAWAKGVVANMARDSKGNDRAQILAVAAGEADLAVANTYYYALMLSGKKGAEQQAAAKKVLPFFPNQGDRGTHMNISGGGILKNAP
jgi:iron(III) transport system substrate-binding protein